MRFLLFLILMPLWADDVKDLAARIEALAEKEPPRPRADTLCRAAELLAIGHPELASHFRALSAAIAPPAAVHAFTLPTITADPATVQRLVEQVEHNGDDPAAYNTLAGIIRANQLSAGLDNPSIRARIALADLSETLNPDFVLTGLDGKQLRFSDLRGKTVLLTFWATWCIPCRAELSNLEKIAADSKDVVILAVSHEEPDTVRDFLAHHPYNVPIYIDPGHRLSDHFHIDTIPATIKFDPLQLVR